MEKWLLSLENKILRKICGALYDDEWDARVEKQMPKYENHAVSR